MSKSAPTIAITGANGFLGTTLQKHFLKLGWQVHALVRDPKKFKKTAGVTYISYDLTKPVNNSLLKNTDYLVHAAFIKQTAKTPDAFNANVKAAQNLLVASRANKLKKNIFISSMSAHDEAVSVYGRQKLSIESIFSGKQDVVLRPGLIIGDGGLVKSIMTFMKKRHMVPLIGGGKQPLQIVSVTDLAQTIQKGLQSPLSGTFTIAHPHVYSYKQFYKKLADYLQTPVLFIPVPFNLLLAILKTVNVLRLPLSVSDDNLLGLKKLIAVDTTADLKKLNLKLDDLDMALKKGTF